jgi:hypothetical protein
MNDPDWAIANSAALFGHVDQDRLTRTPRRISVRSRGSAAAAPLTAPRCLRAPRPIRGAGFAAEIGFSRHFETQKDEK